MGSKFCWADHKYSKQQWENSIQTYESSAYIFYINHTEKGNLVEAWTSIGHDIIQLLGFRVSFLILMTNNRCMHPKDCFS